MKKINGMDIKEELYKQSNDLPASITFENLWSKYSKSESTAFTPRLKLTFITLAAILLLIVPVSAAVLPLEWNGIKISVVDDNGENARIDAWKEAIFGASPSYKDTIENILINKENSQDIYTPAEAQLQFPFAILRPAQALSPTISFGATMSHISLDNQSGEEVTGYHYVFHDIYESENEWFVVTQALDEAATDFLHGKIDDMSSSFVGNWEVLPFNNDNITVMYIEDRKENRIVAQYKNEDKMIVELKVIGNVPKKQLIRTLTSYIPSN